MQSEKVDEVVRATVWQQPKGTGAEAMAAEPVSIEPVLELFNLVLTLPTIVIEAEDRTASAFLVGHQEA